MSKEKIRRWANPSPCGNPCHATDGVACDTFYRRKGQNSTFQVSPRISSIICPKPGGEGSGKEASVPARPFPRPRRFKGLPGPCPQTGGIEIFNSEKVMFYQLFHPFRMPKCGVRGFSWPWCGT
jgi:hypothetical protein